MEGMPVLFFGKLSETPGDVQELHVLWEEVLKGLQAQDRPRAAESVLKFAYFWYNFMPLARGTAAAGYIFILSMFLAAGMPVMASIPKASLSLRLQGCCPHLICALSHTD